MKSVDDMIDDLIRVEGGYSNNPNDLGGETCWGVTVAEARDNGYTGDMQHLPISFAQRLYKNKYWYLTKFDQVAMYYPEVGIELFDTGVNMGTGKAAEFLQMALNALNNQEKYYSDVDEDGSIGPATISALMAYKNKRGEEGQEVLLKALNCLQGARYIEISRSRKKNEDFVYGWLLNRVAL